MDDLWLIRKALSPHDKTVKFISKGALKCSYCDNFKTLTTNAMDEHIKLFHKFESQFSIDAKIGKGSFGEIYMGTNR